VPDRIVPDRYVGRSEPIQRLGAGGGEVAERARCPRSEVAHDSRIGRRFHKDVDRFTADRHGGDGDVAVARRDSFEGHAFAVVRKTLSLKSRPGIGKPEVDE
jgi:hypothetical protein